MGGGESCPECPVCEQKECPSCPECPKCNTEFLTDGDLEYYPVKGTAAMIIVRKIHVTSAFKDKRDMVDRMLEPLLNLYGSDDIPYIFLLTDKKIMNKLSWVTAYSRQKFEVNSTVNDFEVITVALSCPSGDDLVYNNANGYQILQKIGAAFNAIFKKYANYYVLYAAGEGTSVINGKLYTDRFDQQTPIMASDENAFDDEHLKYSFPDTQHNPVLFYPTITEDTKAGDLDVRFLGIVDNDAFKNKHKNDSLLATITPPSVKHEQESFRPRDGGSCICVILAIVLVVCFFMVMFMRTDRTGRRSDVSGVNGDGYVRF